MEMLRLLILPVSCLCHCLFLRRSPRCRPSSYASPLSCFSFRSVIFSIAATIFILFIELPTTNSVSLLARDIFSPKQQLRHSNAVSVPTRGVPSRRPKTQVSFGQTLRTSIPKALDQANQSPSSCAVLTRQAPSRTARPSKDVERRGRGTEPTHYTSQAEE